MDLKAELGGALTSHTLWKGRLRKAIDTRSSDFTADMVRAENQCPFGRWLLGEHLDAVAKSSEHYLAVRKLHARFHLAASEVLALALGGHRERATQAMQPGSEYETSSKAMMHALRAWIAAPIG